MLGKFAISTSATRSRSISAAASIIRYFSATSANSGDRNRSPMVGRSGMGRFLVVLELLVCIKLRFAECRHASFQRLDFLVAAVEVLAHFLGVLLDALKVLVRPLHHFLGRLDHGVERGMSERRELRRLALALCRWRERIPLLRVCRPRCPRRSRDRLHEFADLLLNVCYRFRRHLNLRCN